MGCIFTVWTPSFSAGVLNLQTNFEKRERDMINKLKPEIFNDKKSV